ncbi:hypothetical protein G6F35_018550 [Rhizopus arrhizus]|nr:hypothetical protein G6F35_018550 [Rhizopus arrhizus]
MARLYREANSFARNGAVLLALARATCCGVPFATMVPPAPPAPGPTSMTQSACATARMSCSIITTVLPASTSRCSCTSSRSASDACRPVVGSSSTYSVRPRWLRCSSVASLMRWASPPESSVAGWPSLR